MNHIPDSSYAFDVRTLLFQLGHFHAHDEDGFITRAVDAEEVAEFDAFCSEFKAAVCSYQSMRPLLDDGWFGPVCQQHALMEVGNRCGCPDIMERRALLSEWPEACQREVTTAHRIDSLKLSGDRSIDECWDWGIDLWNEVSGIVLSRVESFSSARIRATAARLRKGILAWSYLPNNNCSETLQQRYNSALSWSFSYLGTTITHEIGHAIGLSHGGRAIMMPYNDPSVKELGPWDIAQARKRYGKPAIPEPPPEPTPEPAPEPPGGEYGVLAMFNADGTPRGTFDVVPKE